MQSTSNNNKILPKWTHPKTDFPSLINHIKSFIEILVVANAESDWNKANYDQALSWAKYIESVKHILFNDWKLIINRCHYRRL